MASAAVANAQRPHAANMYKPAGVKKIQTGIPWVDNGTTSVSAKVDLALPIRGFRLALSGRLVIGTADLANGVPEGFLNLLKNITIDGVNSRQGGNITLWDVDLATLFVIQHLHAHRAGLFEINHIAVPIPGTPFPAVGADGYMNKAQGTYDFRIIVDLPAHPFGAGSALRPGYLIREEEWADTLAIQLEFGTQGGGAVTGSLGTGAGGSTVAFHAFGSGAGTPTIDLYSLPVQMGHLRDQIQPGFVTRVQRPISSVLQSAGGGVTLLDLQKKRSSRFYLKTGTSSLAPVFETLDDTNVTAVGLVTGGGDRNVKPLTDIYAYKADQAADYQRESIQGYTCIDFLQSGNPDSAFAAHSSKVVGTGSTFELVGNVAGEADAYGIVIQEQINFLHGGPLYNY